MSPLTLSEQYPLEKIIVSERIRMDLGDLTELKESISEKGILQPITIDTRGHLVMGGRRYTAARELGLEFIPVIIRPWTDEIDHREVELIENIHRKDLTWQEHLAAVERIHAYCIEKHGEQWWSMRKTAKLLGMTPSTFTELRQVKQLTELVPEANNAKGHYEARKIAKRAIEQQVLSLLTKEAQSTASNSLYNNAVNHYKIGDAIAGLGKLGSEVWNFAEVDPPYGVDIQSLRQKSNLGDTYTEVPKEAYHDFIKSVAEPLYRAMAVNSFVLWWFPIIHYQLVRTALEATGFKVDNVPGIWYKENSSLETNDPNSLLAGAWEPFFIARKGQPALRKRGRSNVFAFQGVPPNKRGHLAERPVELIGELLDTFTWPGARVLVPFLGSGNTLLACYERQLLGLGWDLEPSHKDYFLANVARLVLKEEAAYVSA